MPRHANAPTVDADNPEWTDVDFARSSPATELMPEMITGLRKHRGSQRSPLKTAVSLRLDQDLVERLRGSGPGWQGRANDMLRKVVLGE